MLALAGYNIQFRFLGELSDISLLNNDKYLLNHQLNPNERSVYSNVYLIQRFL